MSTQTRLVLLHGSELGSWIWQRVLPLLHAPAVAVDLPGRGAPPLERRRVTLASAVEHVVREAQDLDGAGRAAVAGDHSEGADAVDGDEQVGGVDLEQRTGADGAIDPDGQPDGGLVLVAHSASAVLVPPVVAALGARVRAVVLIAAAVPEPGRSFVDQQPLALRLFLRALYRVRPAGALAPRGDVESSLCAGLDAETTALVLRRRVPEPPGILLDRPLTAVHLVVARDDRLLSRAVQTGGVGRLGPGQAVLHEVDGGHLAMLGAPAQVAALLDRLALEAVPAGPPPAPP